MTTFDDYCKRRNLTPESFIARANITTDRELNDMLKQLGLQPVSPKFAKSLFKKQAKQNENVVQTDDNIVVEHESFVPAIEEVEAESPRSRRSSRRKQVSE